MLKNEEALIEQEKAAVAKKEQMIINILDGIIVGLVIVLAAVIAVI